MVQNPPTNPKTGQNTQHLDDKFTIDITQRGLYQFHFLAWTNKIHSIHGLEIPKDSNQVFLSSHLVNSLKPLIYLNTLIDSSLKKRSTVH